MKNNPSTNGLATSLLVMALLVAACQGQNAEPGATADLPDDSLIIAHAAAQSQPDTIGPIPEPLLAYLKPPKPLPSQGDTLEWAVSHAADSLLRIPLDNAHSITAWNRMAQQVDSVALAPYSANDFVPSQLARLYAKDSQRLLLWIYDHRNTLEFAQRDQLSGMLLSAAQSTRHLSLRHIHQAIDALDGPPEMHEYLHLRF